MCLSCVFPGEILAEAMAERNSGLFCFGKGVLSIGAQGPEYMWQHSSWCLWTLENVFHVPATDPMLIDLRFFIGFMADPLYLSPNFCLGWSRKGLGIGEMERHS